MDAERRRRLRQSLRNFKRLLSLEPGHPGHLEQLARLSLQLERPREAARYLLDRAEGLEKRGEMRSALADARTALELDPRNRKLKRLVERVGGRIDAVERARTPPPVDDDEPQPIFDLLPQRAPDQSTPVPAPLASLGALTPDAEPVVDADEIVAIHEVEELEESVGLSSVDAVDASSLLAVHEPEDFDAELLQSVDLPPSTLEAQTEEVDDDSLNSRDTHEFLPPSESPIDFELSTQDVDTHQIEEEIVLGTPTLSELPRGARVATPLEPTVARSPVLEGLPRAEIESLCEEARTRRLAVGERLVGAGGDFGGPWLILDGTVVCERVGDDGIELVRRLGPGDLLGTLELRRGGRWRFDAMAESAVRACEIEPARIDELRSHYPALDRALREDAELRHVDLLLATSKLFKNLSLAERARLVHRFHPRRLSTGEIVFREGHAPDGLFLVADGQIELRRREVRLGCLVAGDCVGVLAALTGQTAAVTALATRPSEVFELDRDEVSLLLEDAEVRAAFDHAAASRRRLLTG